MSFFAFAANAQTKKDGTPDMRYRANQEVYGTSTPSQSYSTPSQSYSTPSSSGPDYGGGKHTESHGGIYQNAESGSSHKGGTYTNPNTNDHYGHHKSTY